MVGSRQTTTVWLSPEEPEIQCRVGASVVVRVPLSGRCPIRSRRPRRSDGSRTLGLTRTLCTPVISRLLVLGGTATPPCAGVASMLDLSVSSVYDAWRVLMYLGVDLD